jgi:hypothetical protein
MFTVQCGSVLIASNNQIRTRLQWHGDHCHAEQALAQEGEATHTGLHAQVIAELRELGLRGHLTLHTAQAHLATDVQVAANDETPGEHSALHVQQTTFIVSV